jgi:hypothetical protein
MGVRFVPSREALMASHREHVISIVLSDEDWQAFVRVHPHPVAWLRERIQETLAVGPISEGFVPSLADEANTTSATTR